MSVADDSQLQPISRCGAKFVEDIVFSLDSIMTGIGLSMPEVLGAHGGGGGHVHTPIIFYRCHLGQSLC